MRKETFSLWKQWGAGRGVGSWRGCWELEGVLGAGGGCWELEGVLGAGGGCWELEGVLGAGGGCWELEGVLGAGGGCWELEGGVGSWRGCWELEGGVESVNRRSMQWMQLGLGEGKWQSNTGRTRYSQETCLVSRGNFCFLRYHYLYHRLCRQNKTAQKPLGLCLYTVQWIIHYHGLHARTFWGHRCVRCHCNSAIRNGPSRVPRD